MERFDSRPVEILLIEDNPADVRLTVEALRMGKVYNNLSVARDGLEAIEYLYKKGKYADAATPDLILLDLNLPKKDGRELLAQIKQDASLRSIPVVVLTTSTEREDVMHTYELQANCYITKPVDLEQFFSVVRSVEEFWLSIVKLPSQ